MSDQTFNPLESLVFLTNRVGRLLARDIHHRLQAGSEELQPTHLGLLVDLWMRDGRRQQDLALSLIKDKATIARALDALEKGNIVVRIPDEKDRRNKRIFLTHKGKELRSIVLPHARDAIREATREIQAEDLATCKRVLGQMHENLTGILK